MHTPDPSDCPTTFQRARGELVVTFKQRDGVTVLGDLRQDGCMKARFPRPVDWTEAVTLNSSGGVSGGDRLAATLRVQTGAQGCFAAQACERFYRALPGDLPAHVRTRLTIEPGAAAEWLPQESILFDRCALDRRLDVDVAAGGRFLGLETLVFGRAAMGERVRDARLRDTISIRHAGRLLLHDAIRIEGRVDETLADKAVGGGAGAVCTIVYVGNDAAARLDRVRDALAPFDAGASSWNGMLVARLVDRDGAGLRAAIVATMAVLRDGRALPRVWQC